MKTFETVSLHIAYPGSMQDVRYMWTTKAHGQFLQQVLRSLGGGKLNLTAGLGTNLRGKFGAFFSISRQRLRSCHICYQVSVNVLI